MSQQAPQVRLHIYEAARAPVAVILRQGPSRHTRMVFWDQRDDSFNLGQWTQRKVYFERCDIAPDGKHFLYFMLDGQWQSEAHGSYTAISRPPWFTALALYPQGDTWGGGGYFPSSKEYVIEFSGAHDIIGRAEGLRRIDADDASPKSARGHFQSTRQFGSEGGRLLELFQEDDGAWGKTLIRDFTDMTFEPIRAPYDLRDETEDRP